MTTYAVYISVSNDGDIFFERTWLSAYSLKRHNPTMKVVCMVDEDTYRTVLAGKRKKSREVIDSFDVVGLPGHLSQRAKSRWIKTNLRRLLKGTFLFIDSDTVVCEDLSAIDGFESELMMVRDAHLPLLESIDGKFSRRLAERVYGRKLESDDYFNSGVVYAKDTPAVHDFFDRWHQYWEEGARRGCDTDQQALAFAVQDVPHFVTEMDGIYNAQVRCSVKYIYKGKILHFFTGGDVLDRSHYFMRDDVYWRIKAEGGISRDVGRMVDDCKSLFDQCSYILVGTELEIKSDVTFRVLYLLKSYYPKIFKMFRLAACLINMLLTKLVFKRAR